jgi:hypothetical protein
MIETWWTSQLPWRAGIGDDEEKEQNNENHSITLATAIKVKKYWSVRSESLVQGETTAKSEYYRGVLSTL